MLIKSSLPLHQIYPYEALMVSVRGQQRLPSDVDRARLEVSCYTARSSREGKCFLLIIFVILSTVFYFL